MCFGVLAGLEHSRSFIKTQLEHYVLASLVGSCLKPQLKVMYIYTVQYVSRVQGQVTCHSLILFLPSYLANLLTSIPLDS